MKILQIIPTLDTGGAEKIVVDMTLLLQKKGIVVDVLIFKRGKTDLYDRLNKVTNGKIYIAGKKILNPILIFDIIKYLPKYDLIHVHLFPALYWTGLAKAISFSDTKLIYTEHNVTNKRRKNIIFRFIDRYIYKQYLKIITVSKNVNESIQKDLSISLNDLVQINNGVDISILADAIPYQPGYFSFDENSKILILVSRFEYPKDQKTVINTMKLLPDNVKLLLVGDGKTKNECEKLVENLLLSERILFLGLRNDIPELLKSANIIILSSKYEGLSLSSIEGMASGRPLIASSTPGITDIVKDAGILFKIGDTHMLANSIQHLLNDQVFYEDVTKKCLIRALNYDINTMIDRHIKLYHSLL